MRCLRAARAAAASRAGAWIGRVVDILQRHNKALEADGVCAACDGTTPLLWDTP